MADWQRYREVLQGLYLHQDLPLRAVKEFMEQTHQFEASKAQYERQFKIWEWRKNLTDMEWKYVASKVEERNRPSVVYFQGTRVSSAKLKKEIPRHVLLNDQFKLVSMPQCPEGLIVCSPPADIPGYVPTGTIGTILSKRRLPEPHSCHETRSPKRRQYVPDVQNQKRARLDVVSASETAMYDHRHQRSMVERGRGTGIVCLNLENLPYYKFQDFMRSPGVKRGFEQFFAIGSKRLDTFLAPLFSHQLEDVDTPSHNLELDDSRPLVPYIPGSGNLKLLYNTFGMVLSGWREQHGNLDALDVLKVVEDQFAIVLANTPQRDQSDFAAKMELLRGPPNAQSAHLFVELAVHLHSNHLRRKYKVHGLTDWMIESIPWTVLRPILSRRLATIQAFSETFLLSAIQKNNVTIVRDLLEIPHLIAHVQSSLVTLRCAVKHSDSELISLLLKAGADPRTADDSLLEFAKTIEVAKMLIGAGEDIHAIKALGAPLISGPALLGVVARGNVQVAGYLLSLGADVNVSGNVHKDEGIFTALSLATDGCCTEMVKLLLEAGASVDFVGISSASRCISSFNFARRNLLTTLISEGIRVTALQRGARANSMIVRLLLKHGANVNAPACDTYGETALQAATSKGCIETVNLLLECGANINDNTNGDTRFPKTVLHTAVEMGRYDLVETLLDANADANAPSFGKSSSSILEAAKSRPSPSKIMELLVARGGLDLPPKLNSHRQIELCDAVYNGDFNAVAGLLRIGVKINMSIIPGRLSQNYRPWPDTYSESGTILHWAISRQRQEGFNQHRKTNVRLFKYLVENVQDVNAQKANPALRPILHEVIMKGNLELARILIAAAADVNAPSKDRWDYCATPLHLAAKQHQHDMTMLLLSKGANVNAVVGNHGCTTALQVAMSRKYYPAGCIKMAPFLLSHGAVINARVAENRGRSELSLAARLGDQEFVRQLLRLGADVNSPPASKYGRTALQAAVRITPPNLNMVQLLLDKGADVNAPASFKKGKTALQAAASKGHFQIALLLLEAGADVNAPPSVVNGESALTGAARNGRLDMVYLLLQAGADLHVCVGIEGVWDSKYGIAKDVARHSGHTAITEMLEEWEKIHGGLNGALEVTKSKWRIVEPDEDDIDLSDSEEEDIIESSSKINNWQDDFAD